MRTARPLRAAPSAALVLLFLLLLCLSMFLFRPGVEKTRAGWPASTAKRLQSYGDFPDWQNFSALFFEKIFKRASGGAQCIMHNAQCTMHNAQCIMHNAQCIMHNAKLGMKREERGMRNPRSGPGRCRSGCCLKGSPRWPGHRHSTQLR